MELDAVAFNGALKACEGRWRKALALLEEMQEMGGGWGLGEIRELIYGRNLEDSLNFPQRERFNCPCAWRYLICIFGP